MKQFNPEDYLLFKATTGSRLYGTANKDSDYDKRGVCLSPLEVLIDPFHNFEVKDSFENEEDMAIYDLGKFFNLSSQANPNIIELWFIPDSHVLYSTKTWGLISSYRNLFLSKKIKYTFTGYAFAQIKSIERHRRWFINPPKRKPTREDFGLGAVPIVSEAHLQNVLSLPQELFRDEYLNNVRREKEYRDVKRDWDNFQSWMKNRNPKRRETEERFGYDTKFASHVFRLMTEGKELLLTGNITFPLPNAEWITQIKNGFYQYEEILDMAKSMESEFETWYNESPLPHKPNINAIKQLYFEIVKEGL